MPGSAAAFAGSADFGRVVSAFEPGVALSAGGAALGSGIEVAFGNGSEGS